MFNAKMLMKYVILSLSALLVLSAIVLPIEMASASSSYAVPSPTRTKTKTPYYPYQPTKTKTPYVIPITSTRTKTPTVVIPITRTFTRTPTKTATHTPTKTPTPTVTPTQTPFPYQPTKTPTITLTPTETLYPHQPTITPTETLYPYQPTYTPTPTATYTPTPIPTKDMHVPYIQQYDEVVEGFTNGHSACGPTSAVMALAYFGKLPILPTQIYDDDNLAQGTNDFSFYVSQPYSYSYNPTGNDPEFPTGAYGAVMTGGLADSAKIVTYFEQHLATVLPDPSSGNPDDKVDNTPTLGEIKNALLDGRLVILSTDLTGSGHIILVTGFTADDQLIVNDPNGNALGSGGYTANHWGEHIQYPWAYLQDNTVKWMVIVGF